MKYLDIGWDHAAPVKIPLGLEVRSIAIFLFRMSTAQEQSELIHYPLGEDKVCVLPGRIMGYFCQGCICCIFLHAVIFYRMALWCSTHLHSYIWQMLLFSYCTENQIHNFDIASKEGFSICWPNNMKPFNIKPHTILCKLPKTRSAYFKYKHFISKM